MLRADFDLAEVLLAAAQGDLGSRTGRWKAGASCYVVLAAQGYPEKPELGARIVGLDRVSANDELVVFHAGTRQENDYLLH